jgi:hypothetical protein
MWTSFLLPEISGSYIPSLRMQSPDRFGILLLCQERSIIINRCEHLHCWQQ